MRIADNNMDKMSCFTCLRVKLSKYNTDDEKIRKRTSKYIHHLERKILRTIRRPMHKNKLQRVNYKFGLYKYFCQNILEYNAMPYISTEECKEQIK